MTYIKKEKKEIMSYCVKANVGFQKPILRLKARMRNIMIKEYDRDIWRYIVNGRPKFRNHCFTVYRMLGAVGVDQLLSACVTNF